MILLIDNYDSFTYNLYQQIASLGYDVVVAKHDEISIDEVEKMQPTHIVISPGPKTPQDSGVSMDVIRKFHKTTPILGVCLGHQCIGEVFGAKTIRAKEIVHGKTGSITHTPEGMFRGVPSPFLAARYHSLMIDKVPDGFTLTAWSDDKTIMGIAHNTYPLFGVQFHPESFMTEHGETIMRNFLTCQ
ncbi:aminodeoxychorismate/anthranilate synthase component II [Patescibacteria group bacterium]|nr:MAG: aminodeoxychorismate/anthranilate synthase component II [Patescibacteria group bacterium]